MILVSDGFDLTAGGYLEFVDGSDSADHRLICLRYRKRPSLVRNLKL